MAARRIRFVNNWRHDDGIWSFILFNVWKTKYFIGFSLFNFGLEYMRKAGVEDLYVQIGEYRV